MLDIDAVKLAERNKYATQEITFLPWHALFKGNRLLCRVRGTAPNSPRRSRAS